MKKRAALEDGLFDRNPGLGPSPGTDSVDHHAHRSSSRYARCSKGREKDDLLVDMPPKQKVAEELRTHLRRAGLEREELFADDADRRPFTFHDCRHSSAVWLALTGAPELTIQSRLGHASADMTQLYINESRRPRARRCCAGPSVRFLVGSLRRDLNRPTNWPSVF